MTLTVFMREETPKPRKNFTKNESSTPRHVWEYNSQAS